MIPERVCLRCKKKYEPNGNSQKICKVCFPEHHKEYMKEWKKQNKEKIRIHDKRYREKDIEKTRKSKKEEYKRNKKTYQNYNKLNQKIIREQTKKYREKNREHLSDIRKEYYQNNKIKEIKRSKLYINKRRKNDKEFNILMKLRGRFYGILKHYAKTGKIRSSKEYGIDYKAIIKHLEPLPKVDVTA